MLLAGIFKPNLYKSSVILACFWPEPKKFIEMNKQPAVYILTNKRYGTLYTGVTSNLIKRIWEHKSRITKGFSDRYSLHKLVYYELHENMLVAITREKRIKKWKRVWKQRLIETINPDWNDLYSEII